LGHFKQSRALGGFKFSTLPLIDKEIFADNYAMEKLNIKQERIKFL
jgi:hypothetical protein